MTARTISRRDPPIPSSAIRIQTGFLQPGFFADVAVFDPATMQNYATFELTHHYSTGVIHVFVNDVQVPKDGEHTYAKPGRVVRGSAWKRWNAL